MSCGSASAHATTPQNCAPQDAWRTRCSPTQPTCPVWTQVLGHITFSWTWPVGEGWRVSPGEVLRVQFGQEQRMKSRSLPPRVGRRAGTQRQPAKPGWGQSWEVDNGNRISELPPKSQNRAVLEASPSFRLSSPHFLRACVCSA